jgi:uncharacterized protein
VPALTGPVVDEAGLLAPADAGQLDALARAAWDLPADRRVQLQYLIVPSLEGDSIEDYAVRAFEAWKLGDKGKDNGVLVVVSRDDRKVRIETGYGNEGALTDAQASRIIRSTIAPAFRQQRYGEGLYQAGTEVLSALGALPQGVHRRPPRQTVPGFFSFLALIAIFALFTLRSVFFGPRFRRWGGGGWTTGGWGGGWGGGGWGGGGGGGGSWGGGGGSSGGGGASGGW